MDERLDEVRSILAREAVDASARAEGGDGEILAIDATPGLRPVLARLAPELRECGFRYITLELKGGGP